MPSKSSSAPSRAWKYLSIFLLCTVLPWALYLQFRDRTGNLDIVKVIQEKNLALLNEIPQLQGGSHATSIVPAEKAVVPPVERPVVKPIAVEDKTYKSKVMDSKQSEIKVESKKAEPMEKVVPVSTKLNPVASKKATSKFVKNTLPPVMGPPVTNGSKPLWGFQHKGTDAIFALACKYPVQFYRRFVGTLRKFGFDEDIVLAVSPVESMKPGVENYLKSKRVLSYGFDVQCAGPDNCRFVDSFLG